MDRRRLYQRLLAHYGEQAWWPADSPFEVMVGAILTQNTAWSNVEKALAQLRDAAVLDPEALADLPPERLAPLIRSSGYYNQKAQRLSGFARWYREQGGLDALKQRSGSELRRQLLGLHGIGPETADDMLLYAFDQPFFVIDSYTRRILQRLGLIEGREGYDRLQQGFHQAIPPEVPVYQQYHALIVEHAKQHCRKQAHCAGCPLRADCPEAKT
jgi:endonuclease-3 related protein